MKNSDEMKINTGKFIKAQDNAAMLMFLSLLLYVCAVIISAVLSASVPVLKDNAPVNELVLAVLYALYTFVPVLLFCRLKKRNFKKAVTFKKGNKGSFAAGVFALGVVFFAQFAAFLIQSAVKNAFGVDISSVSYSGYTDPSVLAVRVVYVVIMPAVFEEILTRGFILAELLPYGKRFAVIVSGLLFSLMHMNPLQLPFAFISGVALAYTVIRCGTLRAAAAVHFANNALCVLFYTLYAYAEEGKIPQSAAVITESVITAALIAAGVAACVYLLKKKRFAPDKTDEDAALCTVTDEKMKADLRGGLRGKLSYSLVLYALVALAFAYGRLILLWNT